LDAALGIGSPISMLKDQCPPVQIDSEAIPARNAGIPFSACRHKAPARYLAVLLAVLDATSFGVPDATMRPPSSPAPGPTSTIQSLAAATDMSCSTTITVFPASTNPSSCFMSFATSAG